MKAAIYLYTILLVGLFSSCSKVFFRTTIKEEDIGTRYEQLVLDESVEFYIRTVCRVEKDSTEYPARVMSVPGDCFNPEPDKLIESSYMFIFPKTKSVLVVNNIPDKNQRVFQKEKFDEKLLKAGTEEVEVNIWPLSQFRFGTFEEDEKDGVIKMRTNDKKPTDQSWYLCAVDGGWKIDRVGINYCNGEDVVFADESLYFNASYKRVNYQLVLASPDDGEVKVKPIILFEDTEPEGNRKQRRVYFLLDVPVDSKYNAVRFGKKRTYSFERSGQPCIER